MSSKANSSTSLFKRVERLDELGDARSSATAMTEREQMLPRMPFAGAGKSTGAVSGLAATPPIAIGKRLTSGHF